VHGVFYPSHIKILVVVEKPGFSEPYFEFSLRLETTLRVDLHKGWRFNPITRLVPAPYPENRDGWYFKIRGPYKSEDGQTILDDIQRGAGKPNAQYPIGLSAAVKKWQAAEPPTARFKGVSQEASHVTREASVLV
jgi:hypothetical protein